MHQIKKYANRKMYDMTDKRYISMAQLTELIKSGAEVAVVDNQTGSDITAAVVSQLLGRASPLPDTGVSPRVLMQLLRKGGDTLTDYARKYASLWQGAIGLAEEEVEKRVGSMIRNKELSAGEGRRLIGEISSATQSLKAWIGDRIDRRIQEVLGMMHLASADQVSQLAEQVKLLTDKVEKLETARRSGNQSRGKR